MKPMKLSFLFLAFILFNLLPKKSFSQSISPLPGDFTVCPGELITYRVNPNPKSGCGTYTWTVTNGSFVFNANPPVTVKTTTTRDVDVFWNDAAATGTLKVTSTCPGEALSVTNSYAIRSFADRTPENPRANQLLLTVL